MSETLAYAGEVLNFYVDTDPETGRHTLRMATKEEVASGLRASQPCICVAGRSRYCPRHVD